MSHVHTDILFQLKLEHPHGGEYAHPVGDTPDTISKITQFGAEMYLLELVNCVHGTERCYAQKAQMTLIHTGEKKKCTTRTDAQQRTATR